MCFGLLFVDWRGGVVVGAAVMTTAISYIHFYDN